MRSGFGPCSLARSPPAITGGSVGCQPSGWRWDKHLRRAHHRCRRDVATAKPAPPRGLLNFAEQAKRKGGHRPGTGRLDAAAYAGATRVECRHERLAVGQRCPVCGQGTKPRTDILAMSGNLS